MTVFLCGDVMTGRGIDQALPHPGDPRLHEPYVHDARTYVALAEAASGAIARPIGFSSIWGDALAELARVGPDARIVNLETSVTRAGEPWPKGINYRMHPDNVACLTAAGIDVCALANNHVLDFGREGLRETLATLRQAGIATTGAGRDLAAARQPAILDLAARGRLIVFACGTETSGVPPSWAATGDRAGVDLLPDLSDATVAAVVERVAQVKRPGDVVVASLHWGGNWGYDVPAAHTRFAHALVEGGVDVVHGHSSHHVRPIEVHRGKLILYGCGDLLNDYEGIRGDEEFRGDLTLMYFASVDPASGKLAALRMTPMQIRRFQLRRASTDDARWLQRTLDRIGAPFGTRAELTDGGRIEIH